MGTSSNLFKATAANYQARPRLDAAALSSAARSCQGPTRQNQLPQIKLAFQVSNHVSNRSCFRRLNYLTTKPLPFQLNLPSKVLVGQRSTQDMQRDPTKALTKNQLLQIKLSRCQSWCEIGKISCCKSNSLSRCQLGAVSSGSLGKAIRIYTTFSMPRLRRKVSVGQRCTKQRNDVQPRPYEAKSAAPNQFPVPGANLVSNRGWFHAHQRVAMA